MRLAATCLAVVGFALLAFARPPEARGASLPSGFQDTTVFEGLTQPTAVRFSPDGWVFVAEKSGEILVYDSLSDSTPTVFADLRTEVFNGYDRGLLGLALDPNFPEHPYVYVLYAYDHQLGEAEPPPRWGLPNQEGDECPNPPGADTDGCVISGRLSRLTAVGNEATEEKPLVEGWCQQFSSHSIGDLQFDASGNLYASGGDGASFDFPDYGQAGEPLNPCGDPPTGVGGTQTPPTAEGGALRSQDVRTPGDPTGLDGSVIRVDPETGDGVPGNPMYSSSDANAKRIVAYGFRNPFRFALDPTTGEVYVDNVGWETYEEIDRFNPAAEGAYNSGWPCYEGPEPQPVYQSVGLSLCESLYETPGSTSPPFFYYKHEQGLSADDTCPSSSPEGTAISGLAFYDGESFPASYHGALFFADAVRGCIWAMFLGEDRRPDPSTLTTFMVGEGQLYPGVDLQVGPDGALYYVDLFGEEYGPGFIHRIQYFSGNQPPVAHLSADHEWGVPPLEVHFNAGSSTDADGDLLTYEWDLDGDGNFDAPTSTSTATETYVGTENHTAEVRVTDTHGASSIDRVTIYPGDTPPDPEIIEPSEDLEWSVGQQIDFEGAATDSEDDTLPSTSLDWSARLLHCPSAGCHVHPLEAFPAVDSGSFAAPDHDYPAHIELTLTAADSRGLSAAKTVTIDPQAVNLGISSNPPGLSLAAGSEALTTPFTLTAIKDSHVLLAAPLTQQLGGQTYTWSGWSDGGGRVHTVVAEGPDSYEAVYSATGAPTGSIAGTVIDFSGKAALEGITVCAFKVGNESEEFCEATDASGGYAIPELPAGSYKVQFSLGVESGGYIPQFFNGKASLGTADPVSVTAGATTPGIDAELQVGGRVAGTVTDAFSKAPLAEVEACVYTALSGEFVSCALTNASGKYTVSGLASGSYKVEFFPTVGAGNYISQFYNDKPSLAEADPVSVTAGATTPAIDAEMQKGGRIAGTVTDASTHAALEGIEVCALEPDSGAFEGCVFTDAAGEYTISELVSGQYKVQFSPNSNAGDYVTQYYNGKSSLAAAESISVNAPITTSGINASLTKPAPVGPIVEVPKLPVVPVVPPPPKPLKCKKGFKKRKVHGKVRCSKVKRHKHQKYGHR